MASSTFHSLVQFISEKSPKRVFSGGRQPLQLGELLSITLEYLANQTCMRDISKKFGRSVSWIWNAIYAIANVLEKNQADMIKWPNASEYVDIAEQFHAMSGFPRTLG